MPSKSRVIAFNENSYYHVYNRGNNKQRIFRDEKDYWVFRKIVREALKKYQSIRIEQFALLPNHYHFLIYQSEERALSTFMRSLNVRYTIFLHKKYKVTGRIFESSYQAKNLPTQKRIDVVYEYIKNNPIEAGFISWKHLGISP